MFKILMMMLASCLIPVYSNFGKIPNPSTNLQVYALPVGQGDCTIIQCPTPGQLIVYDCGSSGGVGLNASEVSAFLGSRVDDVVSIFISHGDKDHYNYLPSLTSSANTNIQSVIIGGMLNDYKKNDNIIQNWLNEFGARQHLINGGSSCIGTSSCTVPGGTNFCNNANIKFNILAANVGSSKTNEKSIVLKVVSGTFSVLLPGDIEGQASLTIAQNPAVSAQLESFIYKIAHHGASSLANKKKWLELIKPRQAFASSAYNRGICRHPRCETIFRIQNLSTIDAAPSAHEFYCGNYDRAKPDLLPSHYPAFDEHIYETSPTSHTICLLTYASNGYFNNKCIPVRESALAQLSNASDNECMSSGAVNRFHYSPIVVMLFHIMLHWLGSNL